MRVHFIASVKDYDRDIDVYKKIILLLQENGLTLAVDWLSSIAKESIKEKDWKSIYQENIDAVTKSDVVVAEVTDKSFLVGFQVSTALQMKKPVLLLSTTNKVDSVIGVDLNEENISYSQYNNENLENIIEEFAQQNISDGKQVRFNFFIDKKLLNYLNWRSLKYGIAKSEVIRAALKNDMEKSDYKK